MSFASRTKINDLYFLSCFIAQKNVFWLQIAVNDLAFFEKLECFQDLFRITSDNWHTESLVLIFLYVLKEIFVQQLKYENLVLTPMQVLFHAHDIVFVFWIFSH